MARVYVESSAYVKAFSAEKGSDYIRKILDYAISQLIEPYKEVVNRLIAMINDDAYNRKERLIENLVKLVE